MATFDRNQIKEYVGRVEDDIAHFIGAEFCAARIIGFISHQFELREIDHDQAAQLLKDAHHLHTLAMLGKRYAHQARNPSPEMRIMVLADEKRMQCTA